MTATARNTERPPTVYVNVDVEVDPEDLEADGWVYVGKGDKPLKKDLATYYDAVVETVRRWHDDTHTGPFVWCSERPCHDIEVAE